MADPLDEARRQWEAHDLAEPTAMYAAVSIVRAQQVVSTAIERALRPFDLSFSRYEVLMLLGFSRSGSLPITKMGERLMIHPTGVTRLIDKLERQGFVTRTPHPDDRRSILVELTADGRKIARRATKAVTSIRFGIEHDTAELEELTSLLRRQRRSD